MPAADRDATLKVGAGDTAVAETILPLAPDRVFSFLRDVVRPVRLNPQLAITRWIPADWGFRFAGRNESNDRPFDLGVQVDIDAAARNVILRYDAGLKQATVLCVEPAAGETSRLVVTEHYPRLDDPADPRVAEVDKSLVPWVTALRNHLLARRRWGWLPGWRWWTEYFMLSMPPRQRRIVRLLVWTTAIEFLVFIFVVLIWRLAP